MELTTCLVIVTDCGGNNMYSDDDQWSDDDGWLDDEPPIVDDTLPLHNGIVWERLREQLPEPKE